jgi:hypothetical protein
MDDWANHPWFQREKKLLKFTGIDPAVASFIPQFRFRSILEVSDQSIHFLTLILEAEIRNLSAEDFRFFFFGHPKPSHALEFFIQATRETGIPEQLVPEVVRWIQATGRLEVKMERELCERFDGG